MFAPNGRSCSCQASTFLGVVFGAWESNFPISLYFEIPRFEKDGLEISDGSKIRLLVHVEGVPPFLCVVTTTQTIQNLKDEVSKLYEQIFRQHQFYDVTPVTIRWLVSEPHHRSPSSRSFSLLCAAGGLPAPRVAAYQPGGLAARRPREDLRMHAAGPGAARRAPVPLQGRGHVPGAGGPHSSIGGHEGTFPK